MTTTPSEAADSAPWWERLTPSRVARGVVVVLLVVLGFVTLLALRDVFILLFVGIVLATAVRPLTNRLRERGVPRSVGALFSLLLLVGALSGIAAIVVPFLLIQGQSLLRQLPGYYGQLQGWLTTSPFPVVRIVGGRLPTYGEAVPDAGSGGLLLQVAAWAPTALSIVISLLGAFLFGYYWLLYRERAIQSLVLLWPLDVRDRVRELWDLIEAKIGAFVRGQLVLGVSVGTLSLIGYLLIGLPYAGLLAIIAGVMELVPVVGPIIAAVPAIAVGLGVSPEAGLYAAGVALLVQQLENNLLVPKIMDQTVGVSPVVSLVALIAFAALFGFTGALLAIPLAAVLQVLLDAWLLQGNNVEQVQGRGELALLRYQAQDLTQDLRGHLRAATPDAQADDFVEEELEAIVEAIDSLLAEAEQDEAQATRRQEPLRFPFFRRS